MRPRPSPQTPRWQGRAAAIDRRPWRRPLCASWLSPSKSSLTASQLWQGSHHRASGRTLDRFRVQNQKEVSVAAGSRLSVVILPPALMMPAQPLRCYVRIIGHAIEWPQVYLRQHAGWLLLRGSSSGFLQSVTGDTAMQNKYAEVTPRNFNPMWAPGLSDEARKAVNAAFDAMSTWRIETAKNSEKNSEQVIEKLAAAARTLGWPEQ